ncbi:MAG: 5,10-methylenetetrahydromethanopterin reductase, partial [archaeon]
MNAIELTPERPVEKVQRLAERAEAAGFGTVFASNHYNNRDPFLTLSAIARATEDIALGPGVVNPYESHPVRLASRMATLEEVSDGRSVFGIGAGDKSTLSNLGIERESPLGRVLEAFTVARQLWAGETVDHDGTFQARDASLNYEVGEIPVYVGAQGPHMLRMSAKHADGVLVNAAHPRDLSWSADRIDEGVEERPAERGAVDVAAYASVSIAEDADAAREAARPPVAFIVGSAAPPVLDRHDIDRDRAKEVGVAIEHGDFKT